MKKSYLMIAAAAALFAACSNNDTFREINTQDAVIGFGHSATEMATRAELNMAWFRESDNVGFGVYGFKNDSRIFTNENVVCSNETSPYAWSHTTVRFWDKAATQAYDFYAYAPFAGTNNTEGTNPSFNKTSGFTFTGIPTIVDITTAGADKAVATAVENIDYSDSRLHDAHSNSPTVEFVFNHILSKLSFKIKTDIAAWDAASNPVASFTVTAIDIDFPSANAVQWAETASSAPAGTTTYTTYAPKDGTYETSVFTGSQLVTNTATAIGNTYIVTPVNSTVTKHTFDVKVTYNIKYADGTTETGAISTGTIGTGDPSLSSGDQGYDPNIYAPGQNQYYVAVINIAPNQIEFCVESVSDWNPNGQDLEEVDVE